jgi:hypothetical protein
VQKAVAIHLDKNFFAYYDIRILINRVENSRRNIEDIHGNTTDKILRKFYMRSPKNVEKIQSGASDKMLIQFTARLPAKYLYCGSPQKYRHNWLWDGRQSIEVIRHVSPTKIAIILHEISINVEKILHETPDKILKNFIVRHQKIYWPIPVKFPTIYRDNLPRDDRQNSLYNAGIISQ